MCGGGGGDNDVKETAEERELARVAAKQWNWSQEHVRPLVDDYLAEIDATDADFAKARGEAGMAGHQAFSDAAEAFQEARRDVNPNSGAWKGGMAEVSEDEAATVAGGGAKGHFGVVQDQDRKRLGMLQYGSGKAATALEGVGREASEAAGEAISEARRSFQEQGDLAGAAGTAAGFGVRSYQGGDNTHMKLGDNDYYGVNNPADNIKDGTWNSPGRAFR